MQTLTKEKQEIQDELFNKIEEYKQVKEALKEESKDLMELKAS